MEEEEKTTPSHHPVLGLISTDFMPDLLASLLQWV